MSLWHHDHITVLYVFVAGTEIDGSRVEVVLAKPVDKNDPSRQKKAAQEQQAALAANPLFQVPVI